MPRYTRIHIDGSLALGAEKWSASFALGVDALAPTPLALATFAQDIMGLFAPTTGWQSSLKALISSSGTIDRVRTYSIPDLGLPADVAGVSSQAPVAGAGTPTMPPQCSLVCTLNTGLPGRSRRGRLYWPLVGGAVSTAQRSSIVNQATADAFGDMFEAVLALESATGSALVVASEALGALTVVSTVSVDNIIDTQRRRRDKMTGTRYVSAVVS